jgi:hypothetical protein
MRDQDLHRAQLLSHFAKSGRDLFCIRNVCRDCQRIRSKFSGEFANELSRPREHSQPAAFSQELAHQRCSQAGAYSGDDCYTFVEPLAYALMIRARDEL